MLPTASLKFKLAQTWAMIYMRHFALNFSILAIFYSGLCVRCIIISCVFVCVARQRLIKYDCVSGCQIVLDSVTMIQIWLFSVLRPLFGAFESLPLTVRIYNTPSDYTNWGYPPSLQRHIRPRSTSYSSTSAPHRAITKRPPLPTKMPADRRI